jgi:hypothetical protein
MVHPGLGTTAALVANRTRAGGRWPSPSSGVAAMSEQEERCYCGVRFNEELDRARREGIEAAKAAVVAHVEGMGFLMVREAVDRACASLLPAQQQQAPSPAVASKLCEKCGGKGVLRFGVGVAPCSRCDGVGLLP